MYELLVSEREKASRSEVPDEKDYLATLMAENMEESLDTAIVPYDPRANKLATGQELVLYQPKSAGCQICEYRKAAKSRYENRRMPDYASMSELEKRQWFGEGSDCFYPHGPKSSAISKWRRLAMLNTPLYSPPGGPSNPIDLTHKEVEDLDLGAPAESCYMAHGDSDSDSSDGSETPLEFPEEHAVESAKCTLLSRSVDPMDSPTMAP